MKIFLAVFFRACSHELDASHPNFRSVTRMGSVFRDASSFDGDLLSWDVGKVTHMHKMFYGASLFNQNLSLWDVGRVDNMYQMFYGAYSLNQNLSSWDVGKVTDMYQMFYGASSFGFCLVWDISHVNLNEDMFLGSSGSICEAPSIIPSATPLPPPSASPLSPLATLLVPSPSTPSMSPSIFLSSPASVPTMSNTLLISFGLTALICILFFMFALWKKKYFEKWGLCQKSPTKSIPVSKDLETNDAENLNMHSDSRTSSVPHNQNSLIELVTESAASRQQKLKSWTMKQQGKAQFPSTDQDITSLYSDRNKDREANDEGLASSNTGNKSNSNQDEFNSPRSESLRGMPIIEAEVVYEPADSNLSAVCELLFNKKPKGYRLLRLLLLKSSRTENENAIVQQVLSSFSDYRNKWMGEDEIAQNLAEDYLALYDSAVNTIV
uniref:BspA family leucine-rich repeat surface protein n=1 Tax=Corethron hystrix TaxID=216773 RepID=A0A7S1BLP6_9STRA|mmetsp:Transcript_30597/g.70043  ORF Transcript_30597/g.70043 Transcript_30597/m.70043 type:complete len:438 (+) Transcript_30597:545-1858(+)